MSHKPLPAADAVFGTGLTIGALFDPPIPHATLIRLQAEGKLPVTRFHGTWFTNLGALRRAQKAARLRGEEWARRELKAEVA
jgi:hypothetical protein